MKKWLQTRLRSLRQHARSISGSAAGFDPLITITVSRQALLHNMSEFSRLAPDGRIAPVLKSNAYGHGLVLVAQILESEYGKNASGVTHRHMPFFVIDSYFEARVLREAGIRTPLLVIGYTPAETMLDNRFRDMRFTVGSLEMLRKLATIRKKIKGPPPIIHVKIDTGMRRQGILPEEIAEAAALIKKNPRLTLEGIATHFSDADNDDAAFTGRQIALWNAAVRKFRREFPSLAWWHASNTAGHGYAGKTGGSGPGTAGADTIAANVSRLGIGLYGISDGQGERVEKELRLQPALEMITVISGVKRIRKGDTVGYSRTFIAPHDMTVATVPVGYFEGMDRRLSNKGFVKIFDNKKTQAFFAPVVGRVSMNITVIDVTDIMPHIPELAEEHPAVVASAVSEDKNSVAAIARLCETIPYEILVHIPAHLKRIQI